MTQGEVQTVINGNQSNATASIETAATGTESSVDHQTRAREVHTDSLFGAHPGSVRVLDDVDLMAPILQDLLEAETGEEIAPQRSGSRSEA
jgi:hypothetical protein